MGVANSAFMVLFMCVLMAKVRVLVVAVEYGVGDNAGWIVGPVNYTTWAGPKQFHVGDTLVFSYNKQLHNVLEVTKANYDKCTSTGPLASYNDGNTTVVLKKAGTHYYICGFPGHCVVGQKVEITVLAAAGPSSAPTSPNTLTSKGPALSPAVAVKGNAITSSCASHYVSEATVFMATIWVFLVMRVL